MFPVRNPAYYSSMRAPTPGRSPVSAPAAAIALLAALLCAPAVPVAAPAAGSAATAKKATSAKKPTPAKKATSAKKPKPAKKAGSAQKPASAKKPAPAKKAAPRERLWPDARRPQLGDGSTASEMRVNAKRLVGLRNSFTPDTFARHLAYVADLSGRERFPEDGWARALHRHLSRRKAIRTRGTPGPGDLVLFRMQEAPSKAPDRILVGVVDGLRGSTVSFVAPIGDTVRVARATLKGRTAKDTALIACRSADPPARDAGAAKKGRKSRKVKPPPPPPCRAGDLYLGHVPASALERALR